MQVRSHNTQHGFTLIELLVVVIIISIASTVILIRVSNFFYSNRRAEFLAKEIVAMLDIAKKQAIFSMSVLGLQIQPNEYGFVVLDNSKEPVWKPLAAADTFWAAREIPEGMIVNVQSDQVMAKNLVSEGRYNPQIIIWPSGEMTPFTISIHKLNSAKTYTIKGAADGGVSVEISN